jgi:Leucine-rich repeat (LRR) protein
MTWASTIKTVQRILHSSSLVCLSKDSLVDDIDFHIVVFGSILNTLEYHMQEAIRPRERDMQILNSLTSLPRDMFYDLVNNHLGVDECGSLRSTCIGLRRCVDGVATSLTIKCNDSSDGGTDWCYLQSRLGHMVSLTKVGIVFETSITTSALQTFTVAAGQSLRNSLLKLSFAPYTDAEEVATTFTMPLKLAMLAAFPHLTRLDVGHPDGRIDLTGLGSLSALQHLAFESYHGYRGEISGLSEIANCISLQYLSIWHCNELGDLSILTSCTRLQHLDLYYCQNVRSLSVLISCT